ncbi:hypothetical protein [Bradyrhizobium prioriisuperbiae]|uniref:hypothetical protein n=1 Tax=Bradyrhizobium prioriisuperbiae TaxID=2854389 RepID=UPI0028F0A5F8|nr:hypothetical protein [Bradyrhizobium prioritasuperba]
MANENWGSDFAQYAKQQSDKIADKKERARVYSEAFKDAASSALRTAGIVVDFNQAPVEAEIAANSRISRDILEGLDPNASAHDQHKHLEGLEVRGYSPIAADRDVRIVIGRFKNVDPNTIAAAYPLSRYHFEVDEKRTMAVLLDNYYYQAGYTMKQWIQPYETQSASFVADFIGAVVRHNPQKN